MKVFFSIISILVFACVVRAADASVEQGRALYRSNCAFCHGLTGRGGRGPNLVAGERKSDEQIGKIIKNGVPGSTMPAFSGFEPDEIGKLIAFLHHLAGTEGATEKITGNAVQGRQVYERSGCMNCHQIGTEGSTFGPDLTRIGRSRSLHYLMESILEPSADIPENYEGVTVVEKDGKRITGVRVNEDTFSVQLRLPSQAYRSFLKDEVKEVVPQKQSLMPAYKNMPKTDLDNLVAYLSSLRGETPKGGKTKEAEGIK
jgi:cytochrome c oxidase cbb3-type subunit 3